MNDSIILNLKRNSWGILGPQRDEIVNYMGMRQGPGVLKDSKVLLCDFFRWVRMKVKVEVHTLSSYISSGGILLNMTHLCYYSKATPRMPKIFSLLSL